MPFAVHAQSSKRHAKIEKIKLVHSQEKTRITFEMPEAQTYRSFTLADPSRLVIDFNGARLRGSLPKIKSKNAHISTVRKGSPSKDTLRVVFELKTTLVQKTFRETLKNSSKSRLVI